MAKIKRAKLNSEAKEDLLTTLQKRFQKHAGRHPGVDWQKVLKRLLSDDEKLWSLNEMEQSGGEPDVVAFNEKTGVVTFYDCSPETPAKRRSLCYDREALDARKEHKPVNSALDMAAEMGVEMLDENQYRTLQKLGVFDAKTSSWIKTPEHIRKLGGALFGDFRFGQVFIYHNGAQSYYAARAFRACLDI